MKTGYKQILWAMLFLMASSPAHGITVSLTDIDSGQTSPTGTYRWLDVADQAYSASYRNDYNYTQANVSLSYEDSSATFNGTLTAANLKPNFAYQLKLAGTPGTLSNERIGLAGRWWEQSWTGSGWSGGSNLNNKGNGSSPNPNDLTYFARRDVLNAGSPTGKQYLYSGYLVMTYFVTDGAGNASVPFEANSSYHVLWKESQRSAGANDGPVIVSAFDVALTDPAYDMDYAARSVGIFGEWERLPMGGVFLSPGDYTASLILTEESFHYSGGVYAGAWAAAMGAGVQYNVIPEPCAMVLLLMAGVALIVRKRI